MSKYQAIILTKVEIHEVNEDGQCGLAELFAVPVRRYSKLFTVFGNSAEDTEEKTNQLLEKLNEKEPE